MSKNFPSISIIGCGWLGLPVGKLLQAKGYLVKGSTTQDAKLVILKNAGIHPYLIHVKETITGIHIDDFFKSEILLINIPPGRRTENVENRHPRQIQLIVEKAIENGVRKIIFISSTGVYANTNGIVTESDPLNPTRPTGKALKQIERYLQELTNIDWCILRMAGLVGGDRKAGRFLAGRKNIPNGNAPVNLVHQADCVQIIYEIIRQEKWGTIYNVCADEHPTRAIFYTHQAKLQGFEIPQFLDERNSFKIISNEKLKIDLNYQFIFPDPMEFN